MNVKRFTARTSREALAQVRQTFGADAVVLSTRPCDDGVEVLAMAHESMSQIERLAGSAANGRTSEPTVVKSEPAAVVRTETVAPVEQDVTRLAMSTLSFQDYVRERLLRRRRAALNPPAAPATAAQAQAAMQNTAASATRPRSSAAMVLPSMIRAVMCLSGDDPYRFGQILSSASASAMADPSIFRRFTRDVCPLIKLTARGGTPIAFAISRTSASLASPSLGAARTRTRNTERPSAVCSTPSMASRPPLGVSRTVSEIPPAVAAHGRAAIADQGTLGRM